MCMFSYQGQVHLICVYESASVQVFEWETGQAIHEFDFDLNSRKPKPQEHLLDAPVAISSMQWLGQAARDTEVNL